MQIPSYHILRILPCNFSFHRSSFEVNSNKQHVIFVGANVGNLKQIRVNHWHWSVYRRQLVCDVSQSDILTQSFQKVRKFATKSVTKIVRNSYVIGLQTVQCLYPPVTTVSEYLLLNHYFSLCLQDFPRRTKILNRDYIEKSKL